MSRIVRVKLNTQKDGAENFLTFVGGVQKNRYYPDYESREFQYGLSVFYNNEYILNFVLSEDEVELLRSDVKVKAIDDLGYILLAGKWNLTIMKNRNSSNMSRENELKERAGELAEGQGYYSTYIYDEVQFTSEDENAFCKALRVAMLYPFEESNLFVDVPTGEKYVL